MEESIRQRIKDVLMTNNTSINKFADGNASLQTRMSRQINQGAAISCDTINRVLSAFPDISAEWLMRGKGSMFLMDNLSEFNGHEEESEIEAKVNYDKLRVDYENELEEHQKLVGQLEYMEEYNQRLIVEIHKLKSKLAKFESESKKDII